MNWILNSYQIYNAVLCLLFVSFNFILGENNKDYSQFSLLQISTQTPSNSIKVYRDLYQKADFWTNAFSNETELKVLVGPEHKTEVFQYLKFNGFHFKIKIKNIQNEIRRQETINKKVFREKGPFVQVQESIFSHFNEFIFGGLGDQNLSRDYQERQLITRMTWNKYHRLHVLYEYMYKLEEAFPDIIQISVIGKSFEGRDILIAKVGKVQSHVKPAIFIEGGIHAREWISPATVTYFLRQLVENYEENYDIVDYYDFYILPVLNPDGYEYTHVGDRLWRKSRARNRGFLAHLGSACLGVDLNRNFGFHWNDVSIFNVVGGSQFNCLPTYSGPNAFSEPESRAEANFIMQNRNQIVMFLSYHSFGQKILYPWGHTREKLQDWKSLQIVGQRIGAAMNAATHGRTPYKVGAGSEIQYIATGGSDDFSRGAAKIKWVFLIELPDDGRFGFLLPPERIREVAYSAFEGLRAAAASIAL